MYELVKALRAYNDDCHQWPRDMTSLSELWTNPGVNGWNGPYITNPNSVLQDAKGHNFRFQCAPQRFIVIAPSNDGMFDTEDDVIGVCESNIAVRVYGEKSEYYSYSISN
jgi:hypothetical protein